MTFLPIASFEILRGKKMLLADDLEGNRVLGALFLKIAGAEVVIVANGAEAVKKAQMEPFDAILMDIHMPVLDGLTATQKLRKKGIQSPVIMISSDSRIGIKERAFEVGATGFISKPLTLQRVVQTLSRLFSKSEISL